MTEVCIGFSKVVFRKLLVRAHLRRQPQTIDGVAGFANAQQIDAEQKIDEVVFRLEPARTFEDGNCLGKARLPVELESPLQQIPKAVPGRRLCPSGGAQPHPDNHRDPKPAADLGSMLRHRVTVAPDCIELQINAANAIAATIQDQSQISN